MILSQLISKPESRNHGSELGRTKIKGMTSKNTPLIRDVISYYSNKLAIYGSTPRGVDWNGSESQQLRFEQLCRIIEPSKGFSIADFGCGYGALYEFLYGRFDTFEYTGIDASKSMIESARRRLSEKANANFLVDSCLDQKYDFVFASGVFNVRLGRGDQEWLEYVEETLDMLVSSANHGVAFNCLTSYSDSSKMREDLFYANPLYLFDLCKKRFSSNVALLHDYRLFEFTLLIRTST